MPNVTSIEHFPGHTTGVHFTGSGIPCDVFVPAFSQYQGDTTALIEIHSHDLHGRFQWFASYHAPAVPTGVYGLINSVTGNTFLADLQSQIPVQSTVTKGVSYGYKAFARGGIIEVGRGGLPVAGTASTYCNPGAPLPEFMQAGDCLNWCLLAGSDGWDIVLFNSTDDPVANALNNISLTLNALLQYAMIENGEAPNPGPWAGGVVPYQ